MSIEWHYLKTLGNSRNKAFEELCCQLARYESISNAEEFFRVGAPDAGVECYWKLLNKKEIGWQAKFFLSPPNESQWSQIDESVKTALEKHPALIKYYICLPIDRQDARTGNRKSFMDKWNERVKKWQKWAQQKGLNVTFDYWGESEIWERLSRPELEGKYNYWFERRITEIITGEGELDKEIVKSYLRNIINKAVELPKYLVNAKSNQGKKDLFTHIRQQVEVRQIKGSEIARNRRGRQRAGQLISVKAENPVERIEWNEKNTKNFDRLIILGKAGIGKSWLLRYEAKRIAEVALRLLEKSETHIDEIILPIWINLADWAKHCGETNIAIDSLVNLIIENYTNIRSDDRRDFNILEIWLKRKIRSDKSVILLDALDEIPRNIDFSDKLKIFSGMEAQTAKIFLTCRETEYKGSPIIGQTREIQLLEFEDEQIEKFYQAWFNKDSKKSEQFRDILSDNISVEDLSKIPLLLSLLCALFDKYSDIEEFPKSRAEIYEQCLNKLFLKEWKEKKTSEGLSVFEVKEMMSWACFRIFSEIGEQFTERVLLEKIKVWLSRFGNYSLSPELVKNTFQRLKDDGLITVALVNEDKPEESEYVFLHRTFLEYFAACGLANLNKEIDGKTWEDIVFREDILYDLRWSEVLQLLGGKLNKNDVGKYIKTLLRINGENGEGDILYRPFKLAVSIASEADDKIEGLLRLKLIEKTWNNYGNQVTWCFNYPDYERENWFLPSLKIWSKYLETYLLYSLKYCLVEFRTETERLFLIDTINKMRYKDYAFTSEFIIHLENSEYGDTVRAELAEAINAIGKLQKEDVKRCWNILKREKNNESLKRIISIILDKQEGLKPNQKKLIKEILSPDDFSVEDAVNRLKESFEWRRSMQAHEEYIFRKLTDKNISNNEKGGYAQIVGAWREISRETGDLIIDLILTDKGESDVSYFLSEAVPYIKELSRKSIEKLFYIIENCGIGYSYSESNLIDRLLKEPFSEKEKVRLINAIKNIYCNESLYLNCREKYFLLESISVLASQLKCAVPL